jgi:SulP family sulfate permease
MRRMAETTDVKVISDEINPDEEDSDFQLGNLEHLIIPEGVEVYEINGPYFFGAGNKFEEIMGALRHQRQMPRVRIIRMRKVPFIDSTGIHNLTNLCLMSQAEGIQVVLSGVNKRVQAVLHKAGLDTMLGTENICSHIDGALDRARHLLNTDYNFTA